MAGYEMAKVSIELELVKDGQAKATYREIGQMILGRVYLDKIASFFLFGDKPPSKLRVTIEDAS